jgi:uncharacterized protein (DUF58 family)
VTTHPLAGVDVHARRALRRLRLQLDRLAVLPMAGITRSLKGGSGLEFDQVVKYAYGDDIREIDWNVSARLGDLYRKTFIEDREVSLVCVFADHPALQFGSGATAKRERLLEVASLLLMFATEQHQSVSLLHLYGDTMDVMPFTRDRRQVLRTIIGLLSAEAPPVDEPGPMAPPVMELGRLGRGNLIIWLGEVPETAPGTDWLALTRRHTTLAIRAEDPWERQGPDGAITAFDPVDRCLVNLSGSAKVSPQQAEWRRQQERRWIAWWPRSDQRLVIDNGDDGDAFLALSEFLGRRRRVVFAPPG